MVYCTGLGIVDGNLDVSTPSPATPPAVKNQVSVTLGGVAAPVSFADPFTGLALDPRWTLSDPAAHIVASRSGLSLTPSATASQAQSGASDTTALMQLAQPGDSALSVRVAPGATGEAGLVIYLDASDWVTLLATHGGAVTFCAMAWQQAAPCVKQTAPLAADGSLWLRITRAGVSFTAAASADGGPGLVIGAGCGGEANASASDTQPERPIRR